MTVPVPSSASLDVPRHAASDTSDTSSTNDGGDDGWEDVEPEDESQSIIGLFSDDIYPDVRSLLKDTKERYSFDLAKVQKDLELDFFGTVKLINYIRSEVKKGVQKPDVSSRSLFDDDVYLKPVIEDDALLYNLDDIALDDDGLQSENHRKTDTEAQLREVQEELCRLQEQFSNYRLAVQQSLNVQLSNDDDDPPQPTNVDRNDARRSITEEVDSDYFKSYSYNAIHESMLKDTVRTDAYRDFIYDHKGLFKGKTVLDVGCGTGILSMFCAKAGAKKVIAVDNSSIIEKARVNVFANGFGDVITCIRGKIEEIKLPVPQVDIIVSEWMGYGLLFEAMLDSVIWARDRYLAPGGLMVPSHATLRIAPFADPDFVDSHVSFWRNVYGFDMSSMLESVHNEAIIAGTKTSSVVGDSAVFLQLPLHTITVEELNFLKTFELTIAHDVPRLDGWLIWFDIFFLTSPTAKLKNGALPWELRKEGLVAFTTGPFGPETHWQQCVLLIQPEGEKPVPLQKGQVIRGQIGYQKKKKDARALDIEVRWSIDDCSSSRHQTWSLQ
ncbi:hypothetical protein VTN31DRAFT_1559 [Thermomyces dupontii]|uniref:uncharacterized protein n=1 Tax=Talaromyces thermophilus TaxID=28565 RepID=UPI0037431C55